MDRLTYDKGGSAGSKGVDFQVSLLTVFLLNALQKLKDWKLSTENKKAGKFDDVVLEWADGAVLLQSKHRENVKDKRKHINIKELLSTDSNNDDFSLPKYFFSYYDVKSKYPVKNIIICTNTVIALSKEYLIKEKVTKESMLHYKDGACFFHRFTNKILLDLKKNVEDYFDNNLKGKLEKANNSKSTNQDNSKSTTLDKSIITEKNIEEFLEHLQLYSSYPSEKKLNKVIESLFSRATYSKNLWSKTSSQYVFYKIMTWFQQPEGQFLTEFHAKAIFSELRSIKYCETLEKYNVHFKDNDMLFQDPNKIFHVITNGECLVNVIKIFRTLESNGHSEVLFVNPQDDLEVQNQVIEAFALLQYTFLVIVWSRFNDESIITEVCNRLNEILEKRYYKKVILVAESQNMLAQQLTLNNNSCTNVEQPVTFEDLSEKSKESLLMKNVLFQGRCISLKNLLQEEQEKTIHSEILEQLLRNEVVKVGSKLVPLDKHIDSCYVKRELRKDIENSVNTIPESSIFEVDDKMILIIESAGMGKTTILTKLAVAIKETHPHLWVIRIELNNYTRILKRLLKQNKETVTIREMLDSKEATKLKNQLEHYVFSMQRKVVLMLDGVDEISPNYTTLVTNLLIQCREAPNLKKIFVTTRPHLTQELEHMLKVTPYMLQPFTEANQVDFLRDYWTMTLELEGSNIQRCEQYAELLINKMLSWIKLGDEVENHFAAIPLQLRMLAEIFQENKKGEESKEWKGCKEYLEEDNAEPNLPNKLDITRLYDMFIEKKRDVFMDKANPSGNTAADDALDYQYEECVAYQRNLALEVILEKTKCHLFGFYQRGRKRAETNVIKIGIVQKKDNEFQFIHRTFAEYYVAESLLEELLEKNENSEFQKFFLGDILWYPEFKVIRSFFDSFLQKHVDALPPTTFRSYQCLKYKTRFNNECKLIHLLAAEGCIAILRLILKCADVNIVEGKECPTANPYLLTNDVASMGNTFDFLRLLLEKGGVNIKDVEDKTPLHYATQKGQFEMIKFLVNLGANVNSRNYDDLTTLHYAVDVGNLDTIKFLVEQGVDVEAKDSYECTALTRAIFENNANVAAYLLDVMLDKNCLDMKDPATAYALAYLGRLDMLKEVLEAGVDVNSKALRGETVLFAAARGKQFKTIKYLLEQKADLNVRDRYGSTVTHLATTEGQLDSVKFLIAECNADVNATDKHGHTVLHLSVFRSNTDISKFPGLSRRDIQNAYLDFLEFLIGHKADVARKDDEGKTATDLAEEYGHVKIFRYLQEVVIEQKQMLTQPENY